MVLNVAKVARKNSRHLVPATLIPATFSTIKVCCIQAGWNLKNSDRKILYFWNRVDRGSFISFRWVDVSVLRLREHSLDFLPNQRLHWFGLFQTRSSWVRNGSSVNFLSFSLDSSSGWRNWKYDPPWTSRKFVQKSLQPSYFRKISLLCSFNPSKYGQTCSQMSRS